MTFATRPQAGGQSAGPVGGAPKLPVGGGAIRSIDQSFATNPATGTATMTIALPISAGRSGFSPDLALAYDSGNGNGPFGVGWRAEPQSIGRKLDQRLPAYDESDTFVLGGRDDLVRVLPANVTERDGYRVERFRSRTETAFERVERWTRLTDGDVHWRVLGIDNRTTLYGATPASRVADPDDARRVVTWLPCAGWDDRGNAMVFDYITDDSAGVAALAHERHRTAAQRTATRYLAAVRYGNRRPNLDASGTPFDPATLDDWLFSLVFDYGDVPTSKSVDAEGRHFTSITGAARLPSRWSARADPFSTYRAGFELRTSRLCRRVLMFHHFPDQLGRPDTLVRSLELTYDERPALTRLVTATELGHVLRPSPTDPDRYLTVAFPTVQLTYSDVPDRAAMPTLAVQRLDDAGASALMLDPATAWVDLDGDGTTGLLTEAAGALWYRRNTSPSAAVTDPGGAAVTTARFAAAGQLSAKPWRSLHDSGLALMDVDGDGQAADFAVLTGTSPGFARRVGRRWSAPATFDDLPADVLADPELRWIDLSGDGLNDLARSDGTSLEWFAAQGASGFTTGGSVALCADEAAGLPQLRAGPTQAVIVADMTGDGLADLVRVRNGEVCYWPNLGYGRFGAKVTMSGAPHFADPSSFDPARLLAADLDGSGTTDLVYAGADVITLHLNESGNAWAAPVALPQVPRADAPGDVRATDLLGTGTACVVVTSRRPDLDAGAVRYVDVMGGVKPHLLTGATNGIGLRTTIEYAPSTAFATADAAAGEPWLTTLPFPVHVVHRVITADEVTGSMLTSRFAYHDGCYDGVERELRGFAMVERFDTETFATLDRLGRLQGSNVEQATAVPPTLTRTWFHTGVLAEAATLESRYAGSAGSRSYYREPADRVDSARALDALLPDTTIPDGLTPEEARQAVRALRAAPLREEVYGLDGVGAGPDTPFGHPYVVTEHAHRLLCLQRADDRQPAVFHRHLRETLTTAYDRRPTDPRVTHQLTLDVDPASGQPLVEVAVAYPRRTQVRTVGDDGVVTTAANPDLVALDPQDRTAQTTTHLTWIVHRIADAVDEPDHHRSGLAAETTRWELTGFAARGARFAFDEIGALFNAAAVIDPVDEPDGTTPQRRIVQQQRTLYRSDDLTAIAPLGTCGRRALPGLTLRLALTASMLDAVLARDADLLVADRSVLTSLAADGGGYVEADGNWWIPSSRTFYDPAADPDDPAATAAAELAAARAHFFMPRLTVDPFGNRSAVTLEPAELFAGRVVDALGNEVTATFDYRVLQPVSIVDANGNRSSVVHDALGFVTATALAGKDGEGIGDSLTGIDADLAPAQLRQAFADPIGMAPSLLGRATRRYVHDHGRLARGAGPTATIACSRELHGHQPGGDTSPVRVRVSHLDGNGRTVQEKAQAEAGIAARRDADTTTAAGDALPGALRRDAGGAPQLGDTDHRWIGSGRLVLNNKGKPVRRYDPFFSSTPLYEPERDLTDTGTSSVLFYDPIERLVASVRPEGTYDKVVHTPWRQLTYDVNDTVTADPRTDPDVAGILAGWTAGDGADWQTWFAQRSGGQLGAAEQQAAEQTAVHADTPSFAHLDPLGRPFATIGMNRTLVNGVPVDQPLRVTVVFDAVSNQRVVLDGTDRLVMTYDYDLDGHRLHQSSLDAGELWQLDDVLGCTVRTWDGRGVDRRLAYDELRRPTEIHVTSGGAERLAERMEYGESVAAAVDDNLRLRLHRSCDSAGTVTYDAYDFTGHAVDTVRDLLTDHTTPVDWAADPPTGGRHFRVRRTFDALDRTIVLTTPDGSVQRPAYNAAGLLESVTVAIRGAAPTTIVAGVDYDERGRRRTMQLGNGATTSWTFDDTSHLLRTIRTTRPSTADTTASTLFTDPTVVQDQRFTYDPSGNVTRIDDAAVATVINAGQVVSGTRTFTYDAAYRLVAATGREHVAQTSLDLAAVPGGWRDRPFAGAHPNDTHAMRNYTQTYTYDNAGNFAVVRHHAANAGWTRTYEYAPSRLQPARPGNRLARTTVGNDTEDYGYDDGGVDADGCITRLGPLPLTWDHAHRLVRADLGGGGTARYAHDAAGQRVRTVIDAVAGGSRLERIAVDGFELIRTISGTGTTTASREVLHVMADDERVAIVETITVDGGITVADPRPLVRHQLTDHLGSSVAELDGDGSLISVEEYHSFGTTSFQAGRSATEVNLRRYRFTGHERDAETGLVQCGRRAYVPWLGRWSSPDPIGVADGTNGFVYARNNPLVFVDRAGTDVVKVVTTNNHRDLLRDAIGKVQSKTPDDKAVDAQNKRIDLSKPAPKITDMSTDAQIERDYRARIPLFGRITTKLSGFSPPGWEDAGGNEAACFKLACQGADKTAKKGETATGGGGVILYEATEQRIRTDKDASDLALAQIKRHVDAGRALVAGISEPAHKGVVDAQSQPVTDHFVDIYGYETDETGRITALFAKDNAVGGTAEVRFDVAADGSITKPADPKRKDYIAAEYQLSEVRFHTGFEYKDALRPKNDAKELMVWPNPDPKPPPPPKPKK